MASAWGVDTRISGSYSKLRRKICAAFGGRFLPELHAPEETIREHTGRAAVRARVSLADQALINPAWKKRVGASKPPCCDPRDVRTPSVAIRSNARPSAGSLEGGYLLDGIAAMSIHIAPQM